MSTLYPAIPNSPVAKLTSPITNADVTITVDDATKLPDAPNLATLGSGESNETILYTGKDGNNLTGITRGLEGVAQSWDAGTPIARLFTAYDYNTLIQKLIEIRSDSTKPLAIEVRTTDPATPAIGQIWLITP